MEAFYELVQFLVRAESTLSLIRGHMILMLVGHKVLLHNSDQSRIAYTVAGKSDSHGS